LDRATQRHIPDWAAAAVDIRGGHFFRQQPQQDFELRFFDFLSRYV
jgi:hypothetical protein